MRIARNRLLRCALAFSLISVIPALADLEAGKRAYEQRDYRTALKELKPLAEQGNPEAQALLGLMYSLGRGVPFDVDQAMKWFKAAADQGNAEGQCRLGSLYLRTDTAQGLRLLKFSANQGFADAYLLLGLAYMNLKDAPLDLVQADMWLQLAAAAGDPLAAKQRARAEGQMTPDQVAKARLLAAAWKPKTSPSAQGRSSFPF
jgi:TPR repeat protein